MSNKTQNLAMYKFIFSPGNLDISCVLLERERERERDTLTDRKRGKYKNKNSERTKYSKDIFCPGYLLSKSFTRSIGEYFGQSFLSLTVKPEIID
ncbi:MAG: hypothetical protein LBR26_17210 [Prevotella sp.]|jgi:hypothetical protein|nr:hypothetical protein [Prevotella sp.]